jgi:hypothetical protein
MSKRTILLLALFLIAEFGAVYTGIYNAIKPTPVAHTIPMPTQIDVNGTQWRVQIVSEIVDQKGNQYNGYTHCETKVIDVVGKVDNKKVVLWHELSHAAVCMGPDMDFVANNFYYNSTSLQAHEGITRFAEIWDELFHRNPDLAAYLGSKE